MLQRTLEPGIQQKIFCPGHQGVYGSVWLQRTRGILPQDVSSRGIRNGSYLGQHLYLIGDVH